MQEGYGLSLFRVENGELIPAGETFPETDGSEVIDAAGLPGGQVYQIVLTKEDGTGKIYFYNVSFEGKEDIHLKVWDEYTYITYTDTETKEEKNTEQFRIRTFPESLEKYSVANLNVRSMPDNNSEQDGQVAWGEKIELLGEAIGLVNGSESKWYLIRRDDQYRFIIANDGYYSDEKPEAQPAPASGGGSGSYPGGGSTTYTPPSYTPPSYTPPSYTPPSTPDTTTYDLTWD